MARILAATAGAVTPNDFYDLPVLPGEALAGQNLDVGRSLPGQDPHSHTSSQEATVDAAAGGAIGAGGRGDLREEAAA